MSNRTTIIWLVCHILTIHATFGQVKSDSSTSNPFYLALANRDFSANPGLADRICASPHSYFRFINVAFSQAVCQRFREAIDTSPTLNLHGDAHLEQYAVTDLGRGLTDYDDAASGPGVLDLVRFGVSLRLACSELNWPEQSNSMLATFLNGYRQALDDPALQAPEPEVVQKIAGQFTRDREKYLAWIRSIMAPMPTAEQDSLGLALQPYFDAQRREHPETPQDYFKIVAVGYLHMGIGSALDLKYLARIQGKTAAPEDDVLLEIKEVRDLRAIDCIVAGRKSDPFRVLLGQARIAYQPFHHLGYFRFRSKSFWVQSWVDNYKEIQIGKSFASAQELAQVAYDVGVQLGQGQVKYIATPFEHQLRQEQKNFVTRNEAEIISACKELAEAILAAWQQFCAEKQAR